MKGFPDLPPIWLVLCLVLNWVVASALPGVFVFAGQSGLSWGGIGLGILLIGWSAFWFWRRRTTIEPHHTPTALIVEGPYRVSRNPIYLGMVVILLAAVIGRGQFVCLILVPAFVWIIQNRFIEPEEQALRDGFGAEAERYFQATRRWI